MWLHSGQWDARVAPGVSGKIFCLTKEAGKEQARFSFPLDSCPEFRGDF